MPRPLIATMACAGVVGLIAGTLAWSGCSDGLSSTGGKPLVASGAGFRVAFPAALAPPTASLVSVPVGVGPKSGHESIGPSVEAKVYLDVQNLTAVGTEMIAMAGVVELPDPANNAAMAALSRDGMAPLGPSLDAAVARAVAGLGGHARVVGEPREIELAPKPTREYSIMSTQGRVTLHGRVRLVVDGRRVYHATILAGHEASLDSAAVKAFVNSLRIVEPLPQGSSSTAERPSNWP